MHVRFHLFTPLPRTSICYADVDRDVSTSMPIVLCNHGTTQVRI